MKWRTRILAENILPPKLEIWCVPEAGWGWVLAFADRSVGSSTMQWVDCKRGGRKKLEEMPSWFLLHHQSRHTAMYTSLPIRHWRTALAQAFTDQAFNTVVA